MLLSDSMVHDGLSELWLINFVMSIFSVTDDINEKIFAKFGAILNSELDCTIEIFYAFTIDMNYGYIVGFENICRVFRGTRVDGPGCIADLVVGYDMY